MEQSIISLREATVCHSRKGRSSSDIVLTDVNMEVGRGELIYFVGKIGSGKSSLLKMLYGEIPMYNGEGMVAGYNLERLRQSQVPYLRRKLGIVFQDFQLLPDRNLYSNLEFVLKATRWRRTSEIKQRIEQMLELVGLTHMAYEQPHRLSRGQQQRLAVGRAFINHPELILADEPTGNLDFVAAEEVMELFMDIISMGTSVIIATHDMSIIERYPSRTFAFEDGKVFEIDLDNFLGGENNDQ